MLKQGDKIGLVACSNGLGESQREKYRQLLGILEEINLEVVCSPYLFASEGSYFSATGKKRAEQLMIFYKDPQIKMIFDLSGGDIANEVISELDFEVIRDHPKPFWGYSDLTTIINAIYTMTGNEGYLYQLRNLVGTYGRQQIQDFKSTLFEQQEGLYDVHFDFIQGNKMSGEVVGGNIRCFLKLAGTPYWPDLKDKILLLEARGGKSPQMITYLHQLKQLGAFSKVKGILLGTFTVMQQEGGQPNIEELVKEVVGDPSMPIAKTNEIGHGEDSKCIRIGKYISINK